MSSSNSSRIISIYKSRNTILELLDNQDYNTEDYLGFSINEIDAMLKNSQLDMLLTHNKDGKKVYVKYYFNVKQTTRQIKPQTLDDIIEDLFSIEEVLTKNDTLVIIIDDEPNDTILAKMRYLYDHDGIFVVIHNIQRLQFNILNHSLVPAISVLTDEESTELKTKYNLKNNTQLPEISRFDPQALAIGLRPGQICAIERESMTAMEYKYYRICV
jgi:DNA-directed RNA polymerase subunit H (RpoH/RPB5)/nitrate reductase NapAB chaperone NapD